VCGVELALVNRDGSTCRFEDSNIASATHNIMAYTAVIDGVPHKDCDDDGEAAAGGRLAHLLHVASCGNVMVVVTRW
jgi:putative IMPACT (imprinted ancient) family translation regulator